MDRGRVVDHTYRLVILGCTLHFHILAQARTAVSKKIPDFARTPSWTIDSHKCAHRTDRKWLKREIARVPPGYRVFVVSHFPPSFDKTSDPKYEGNADRWHFGSETLRMLQACRGGKRIVAWGYGHTHQNTHGASTNDTKVFSNQYHRSTGNLFARDAVVEVLPPPAVGSASVRCHGFGVDPAGLGETSKHGREDSGRLAIQKIILASSDPPNDTIQPPVACLPLAMARHPH